MFKKKVYKGFRRIGKDVTIRQWVRFARKGNICIGNHVIIDDFVLVSGGADRDEGNLATAMLSFSHDDSDRDELTIIGDHVHIACFSSIIGGGGVTLGDYSGLSPGCRLFSETDDYTDGALMNPTVPAEFHTQNIGRITLGKYVILGANVVVLPGVTIGEGAVVGACSLVTKDIEPWAVNAGVPTRVLKWRNREEVLRRAEELEAR